MPVEEYIVIPGSKYRVKCNYRAHKIDQNGNSLNTKDLVKEVINEDFRIILADVAACKHRNDMYDMHVRTDVGLKIYRWHSEVDPEFESQFAVFPISIDHTMGQISKRLIETCRLQISRMEEEMVSMKESIDTISKPNNSIMDALEKLISK